MKREKIVYTTKIKHELRQLLAVSVKKKKLTAETV